MADGGGCVIVNMLSHHRNDLVQDWLDVLVIGRTSVVRRPLRRVNGVTRVCNGQSGRGQGRKNETECSTKPFDASRRNP
jgi:hypothetical protein